MMVETGKFLRSTLARLRHLRVSITIKLRYKGDTAVARLAVIASLLFFLLTLSAAAQVPTSGNIFFGYSYNHANFAGSGINLNGWDGSLEGKVLPHVGIVADVSGQYGSGDSIHSAIFGPRVSISFGKIRPFAHALLGVSHFSGNGASDTSFADALGGGVDYRMFRVLGWRFQLDALQTRFFGGSQDDFRFSTGLVFHF
jgi:hypothetical protein